MSSSYVTNTAQAACIKHLSYDPKKRIPTATKQGWYIFDGNAYDFPLWEFKLNLKLKCLPRDDDIAINKMKRFYKEKLNDQIIAASDAFFPFVEGIEKLVQAGVSAIIQPSGSIRDKDTIKFANRTNTILVFSKTRHFRH